MDSTTLLRTLQNQFIHEGILDVSELDDPSYLTIFTQLGIPEQINISSENPNGWYLQGDTISFEGTISGNSIVLGLPASTSIIINFIPVENSADQFTLELNLFLTSTWRFGQSFTMLNRGAFNALQLIDSLSDKSKLIVHASSAVVNAPSENPSITFYGFIDPNSSLLSILSYFISGGIQNPISGEIRYLASTGAVDMNIPLSSCTIFNLFGSSEPSLTFTLSLFSGLNEYINLYEPGISFETDILFGTETIGLQAIYSDSSQGSLSLKTVGQSISLNQTIDALSTYFGNSESIINSIPNAISLADLNISGLAFRIGLTNPSLDYCWLAVTALENTEWEIWPGYISLSSIEFSFTIWFPFTPANTVYSFSFAGVTRFGGDESGLPLLIRGDLPGLQLSASLYGGPYNLMPFLTFVFDGDKKGLPDDLYITELTFGAVIPDSYYYFNLEIDGDWRIPFGHDNKLDFNELKIHLEEDDGDVYATLTAKFSIKHNKFGIELDLSAQNQVLLGSWHNEDSPLDYEDIAIAFGMYGLPNIPTGLDLALSSASFELETAGPSASFTLTSENYGSAAIILGKDEDGNWGFVFGMIAGLDLEVNLTDIDVVGNFVPEGMDVISVSNLRFVGATSAIPLYTPTPELLNVLGTQINSGLVLSIDLNIGTLFSETFSVRFGGLDDGTASDTPPEIENENGDAENSGNENPPAETASLELDTTTAPVVPAALPGPTSAWINVQRSFGPVQIARIGFRITEDNSLGILLDAGVSLAGLSIGLSGLEADIPISSPYWPSFSLAGLEVGYTAPGITIAGALIKAYGVTPTMYTGELILQAGNFGASAFGSYTTVDNEPSLFAFLALNIPIGGPPFCVITGLSMGFGYNRRLILPTIDTVQSYPLVQAAMGITDPQQTIDALNQYIVPAENQYWLAAGIRFTSFEMLNAYAMLTASFGTQVELALMGEALLTLPIAAPGEEELILAQADMVLLASIIPSLGQISISAQLTSRSYILDRNAQITGGFAFYFWFGKSAHKGDFVVSLGGYNPYFTKPDYYPRVPLLGLNWQISNLISIKGGLYCALTPSVIMAGGNLSATYASGEVKAWFNANADFLIRFKPFSFESTIAVSVGASYKLNLLFTTKTISVSVGASLKLWGPPFAGTATVDLGVMSFTIAFGAAKRPTTTSIGWTEFRNSFLPKEPTTQTPQLEVNNGNITTQSLIQFNADRGLISSATADQLGEYGLTLPPGSTSWRLNPGKSRITITTSVPSKTTTITPAPDNAESLQGLNTNFGIGPMSLAPSAVQVNLAVTVYYNGVPDTMNRWSVKPLTENIPSGLWLNTSNSMNSNALVKNVLQGIQLIPKPARPDILAPLSLAQLLFYNIPDPRYFFWSPTVQPASDVFNQASYMIANSLNSPSVMATQNDVLSVLAAQGLDLYTQDEIDMQDYASDIDSILYNSPQICYLGETSAGPSTVSVLLP
jgi:hypothetical protein